MKKSKVLWKGVRHTPTPEGIFKVRASFESFKQEIDLQTFYSIFYQISYNFELFSTFNLFLLWMILHVL